MLVLFHCESNPGFAASTHEHTFLEVAERLVGARDRVHFAYRTLEGGMTPSLPTDLANVIELDTSWNATAKCQQIRSYIAEHGITLCLGFDQPPRRPLYGAMRAGGLKHFVAYHGAPVSSIKRGPALWLRKAEMLYRGPGPDHYVFQSDDMRRTATHGRGIPASRTSVVRTGIDTERYRPLADDAHYVREQFGIPSGRSVIFFSGHMEERKGVHIVLQAAAHLVNGQGRRDVHFLILGNRNGQEQRFAPLFRGTEAEQHITFGGYRADVPRLLRGCAIGIIASTGWDSFPMSSLEMAATELPLVVSDLPGLRETVTEDTGVRFPVGDASAAAAAIAALIDDPDRRARMGRAGRARVLATFSRASQVRGLEAVFRSLMEQPAVSPLLATRETGRV